MASIVKVSRADGTVKYRAHIVIKKGGVILHRESKSFDKQKLAKDWAMRREVELQTMDVYKRKDYLPISTVIEKYLKEFPPPGRSKNFDINKLLVRDIAKLDVHKLESKHLIKHIAERNKECLPQTANNDLVWLSNVLSSMSSLLDYKLDASVFKDARQVLRNNNMISKSSVRDRVPTNEELRKLSRYFHGSWNFDFMWFAIYSTRRQSEISRLLWDDINHSNRTCLLRDLKDPRRKNEKQWFKLPMSAYKIIMKQPRVSDRIFPHNSKTAGDNFTNACAALGIEGLHFHDLRRLGVSYLVNVKKLTVTEVMQISLHKRLDTLMIYYRGNPGDIQI